jgi:putative copper export protein
VFLATDLLVLGLRALTFVALLQAAGTVIFLRIFERDVGAALATRCRNLARLAAVVALTAAVLHFVLTPARMAGDLAATFDPALGALLLESSSGTAHIVRVVGLALVLLALDRASRRNDAVALLGAGLTLLSFALMGHTTIHPQRWLLAPLLLAHLGVGAFWFGALLPLRWIVGSEAPERAAAAVARFSALAARLVPAIFVCGVAMTAVLVRSPAELATGYGALLLAKTGMFAVLMGLAAANKWRFGPRLGSGDGAAAASLRRTVAVEWLLIAVLLIGTAVGTSLYSPEHLEGAFAPEHRVEPAH